jgi:hypothetical protein
VVSAVMLRVHVVPLPEQPPPLQLPTFSPTDGAAVRVTDEPGWMLPAQVPGQLIPPTLLVTLPPEPALTVRLYEVGGAGWKLAVAVPDEESTVQGPDELVHAPLQPVKTLPIAASAVSVTVETVRLLKAALQVEGQSIPVGLLVTVPEPLPLVATLTEYVHSRQIPVEIGRGPMGGPGFTAALWAWLACPPIAELSKTPSANTAASTTKASARLKTFRLPAGASLPPTTDNKRIVPPERREGLMPRSGSYPWAPRGSSPS